MTLLLPNVVVAAKASDEAVTMTAIVAAVAVDVGFVAVSGAVGVAVAVAVDVGVVHVSDAIGVEDVAISVAMEVEVQYSPYKFLNE